MNEDGRVIVMFRDRHEYGTLPPLIPGYMGIRAW
jgi:hypothetical protein